jgi:hypothetical protein
MNGTTEAVRTASPDVEIQKGSGSTGLGVCAMAGKSRGTPDI